MLAKILSFGINGLDVYPVTIEVDVFCGLPNTVIVGLPDNAVKESKERVRSAIKNSGYKYPPRKITINLSPADIKKEGPSFDLAIALGVLAASEQLSPEALKDFVIMGELSLDGSVRSVSGVLPIALSLKKKNISGLIIPEVNCTEAAIAQTVPIYPVRKLAEVKNIVTSFPQRPAFALPPQEENPARPILIEDFSEVKAQQTVKRGLEIAASGGHNVLMLGPPGSGKTMLAKRLPTILPEMTREEAVETTRIHSIMGLIPPGQGIVRTRPFRSPHHTSSDVALVGGGTIPKPGEVTLSHNGVLFLDELPEFNRNVLEALRQPLEDHTVVIARASKSVRFPAKFMLIASMNPCPCGFYTDPKKECRCSPPQVKKYHAKISGPLLDRIDIHLEVPALPSLDLLSAPAAESSQSIKTRVQLAREIQAKRFQSSNSFANAQMQPAQIKKFCSLSEESKVLMKRAIEELGFSARGYDKVLKISRTISDLAGSEAILPEHLAEAIQYRCLDRNWWG